MRVPREKERCDPVLNPAAPLRLERADVLSFVALLATANFELDALTLLEGLEACPLNGGEVHKDVIALLAGDEAVTLLLVEKLHGACGQRFNPSVHRDGPND